MTSPSRGFYQTLLGNFVLQLSRELLLCLGLTRESIYDTRFTWDLVDNLDSRRSFLDDFWSTKGCLMLSTYWDISDGLDPLVNDFNAFDPLRDAFDVC